MGHAHMRQNEKAAIVNDQPESLLALLGAPTDEAITGFDFPGRAAKEQAGQIASVTVSNNVAQVMMLAQMPNKGVGLSRAWLDRDHFQRLQSPKRTLNQLRCSGIQSKEF